MRCFQIAKDLIRGVPVVRSVDWPQLAARFKSFQTKCQACDSRYGLEVHHKLPVHVDKQQELDWNNLITLCRRCHFLLGHLKNWKSYNAWIEDDARRLLLQIRNRP